MQSRNDMNALEMTMPVGYLFCWRPMDGGPDLSTAQKVRDYFGFGEWKACYGRNLISGSNFMCEATKDAFADTSGVSFYIDCNNFTELFSGKTFVFSYYVNCPGDRTPAYSSLGERFGIHGALQYRNTSTGDTYVNYPFAAHLTSSISNSRVYETFTFNLPSGYDVIDYVNFSFQPMAKPADNNNETWKIGMPKLEFGIEPTDWTPAPEDISSSLAFLPTDYKCYRRIS